MKEQSMKKQNIKLKTVKTVKTFRLQSKELFLTYPQSGCLELQYVIDQLELKLSTFILRDYLLCKELHEDGNPHLHIYLKMFKKTSITNATYFDIELDGVTFHPNVQPAKKAGNVIKYILKCVSSKYSENLLFSKGMSSRIDDNGDFMSLPETIMSMAEKGLIKEALNLYKEEKPLEFIKTHQSLEKSLRSLYLRSKGITAKFDFSKYNLLPGMKEQLNLAFNTNKSIVLIGDSGRAKLRFVESYCIDMLKLTPLTINNFDSIKNYNEGFHNAIIIDDTSFKDLDRETIIKLLDSEECATFRVTYGSVTIPANVPRFILSNLSLDVLIPFKLEEAFIRRIEVIYIAGNKLFIVN